MPREIHTSITAIDLSKFELLSVELGNRSARRVYAKNFLDMLPGRVHRINAALSNNDTDTALDSAVSLKVASSMLGGSLVEKTCLQIERAARAGKFCQARREIPGLESETFALEEALHNLLNPSKRTRSGELVPVS